MPGRATGSYVTPEEMESVTALRTFAAIWEAESVRRMREVGSGVDLDILEVGSFSERIRLVGAAQCNSDL